MIRPTSTRPRRSDKPENAAGEGVPESRGPDPRAAAGLWMAGISLLGAAVMGGMLVGEIYLGADDSPSRTHAVHPPPAFAAAGTAASLPPLALPSDPTPGAAPDSRPEVQVRTIPGDSTPASANSARAARRAPSTAQPPHPASRSARTSAPPVRRTAAALRRRDRTRHPIAASSPARARVAVRRRVGMPSSRAVYIRLPETPAYLSPLPDPPAGSGFVWDPRSSPVRTGGFFPSSGGRSENVDPAELRTGAERDRAWERRRRRVRERFRDAESGG